MDQHKITCSCNQQFTEEEFTKHYSSCHIFKSNFKDFDKNFGELLKSFSEPKERLLIVRFLLKQYINVIDKKLKKYFASLAKGNEGDVPPSIGNNPPQNSGFSLNNKSYNNSQFQNNNQFFPNSNNIPFNEGHLKNQNSINENPPKNEFGNQKESKIKENPFSKDNNNNKNPNSGGDDFMEDFKDQPIQKENVDLSVCQICKIDGDIVYLSCVHPYCRKCFNKSAEANFYGMKCMICDKEIDEQTKRSILSKEKYSELENNAIMMLVGQNMIKCPYPNCGELNCFEPGKVDYNVKDEKNQKLSKQAAEDYASHRCRCGFCKKDFCTNKTCLAMPYHLGKTCEEFSRHKNSEKCRYCDTEIKFNNRGPDDDVCNDNECYEKYKLSCKKKLPCGHKCFGVNGEKICPPCIDKECPQFKGQFGQNKDDYCVICYTEGLVGAPIVALSCGHYMHYICVKKRLQTKWIGPKITFNHCLCPSCNKWFDCQTVPELQKMIDENKKLYEEIKEMSLKRLKFEDLDKDPRLTDPKSPWFGKKVEFAMKRLSYYMCYVCKKPYFAGRRECGNDPNMNNEDPNKNYDPKELVCGKDANLSGVAGKTNCQKHGRDFIEYKCRFCCKIASWFCWGTTHFCEDCHKRQCNGDYVSKYPRDRLPRCTKGTCEVGGNHPPNGEEFALGCSICRNNAENAREF